ncbi:MAG: hypothetical protein AB8B63_23445, partial [Granulosicoccus sp.]
ALINEQPEAVKGLVIAIAKAMQDVISNPAEGVAVITATEPLSNEELELKRLDFALNNLIYSEESKKQGIGAVDSDRLSRSIAVIQELYDLPSSPEVSAVFSDAYLPPLELRSF